MIPSVLFLQNPENLLNLLSRRIGFAEAPPEAFGGMKK